MGKILVCYFSATGATKRLAEKISGGVTCRYFRNWTRSQIYQRWLKMAKQK